MFQPGSETIMFFVMDRNLYGYKTRTKELRHYLADTNLPENECDRVMGEMTKKFGDTANAMTSIMATYGGTPIGDIVELDDTQLAVLERVAERSLRRN